jgi:hypothetical protein
MSLLLSVLRAAHCRSTHHYFALDSLRYVDTPAGLRLGNLLQVHHEKYLTGAKDPDDRFRDFQNHCVHVRDGYWGGAPRLAIKWYDRLRDNLVAGRSADAAYAAGVLSHYFTDPLQPLHTGQTPREPIVHRAIEWSVRCCYDEIFSQWKDDELRVVFQLGDSEGWLAEAILKGARFANRGYDRLVNGYDLELGSRNPKQGLDADAKATFAPLFGLAITGLARIWERVADEAEAVRGEPLPTSGLGLRTLLAGLEIPEKWIVRRIHDRREREEVAQVFEEFRRTGQVVENIPSECYVKQQVWLVHQREVAWRQSLETTDQASASSSDGVATSSEPTETLAFAEPSETLSFVDAKRKQDQQGVTAGPRFRLSREDSLVDAPSIGPKTAVRFADIAVTRVGQLLDEEAESLASRLATRWITAKLVADWQAQSRLMCGVPGLLARDTQLLVGAGYRTVSEIRHADAGVLHDAIGRYAATGEGQRALRGGEVPGRTLIERWVASLQEHGRAAA